MGNFLSQNAGTIGTVGGTVGGSLVGQPQLGGAVGGMAGSAIGNQMRPDDQKTIEQQGMHREAQMQLLKALIMAMQQSQQGQQQASAAPQAVQMGSRV